MILVTGGTGLLGAHLLFDLLIAGQNVRAIKRPTSNLSITKKIFSYYSDNYENLFSRIEWINADILDIQSLDEAFEGVDFVYHCAAIVSFDNKDKEKVLKSNIDGTSNIINTCLDRKIKKLCHVSSVSALGDDLFGTPESPKNEDTKRDSSVKHSNYSISKYNSELEVWRGIGEGLNAVIVNPSIILGPGNWDSGSSLLFYKAWKGLSFYTSGVTGFVDVRDVTETMIKLMNSNIRGERYCQNSENVPFREFFNMLSDNLGKKRPSIYVGRFLSGLVWRLESVRCFLTGSKPIITQEAASASISKVYYSSEKIENELNFKFRPVKKSVEDFSKYFLQDFSDK